MQFTARIWGRLCLPSANLDVVPYTSWAAHNSCSTSMVRGGGPATPTFHGLPWDQVRVNFARPKRAYVEYANELDTLTASMVSYLY